MTTKKTNATYMKKTLVYFLLLFIMTSCGEKIKESDLTNLDGFWEIEKVELANDILKEYKINEEVEQIQYKNNEGVRRKVVLLYNGNFLSNNIKQKFSIQKKEDSYYIINKTDFSEWEEEIISLSNDKLVVKNKEGMEYYYKKRNDIKLETNGKKE